MVRLDRFDTAQVTLLFEHIEQPGAAFNIVAGLWVDPGGVQPVVRSQLEGLDPFQYISAAQLLPTQQVGVADATVVGIHQLQAAVPAAAAAKRLIHRYPFYGLRNWYHPAAPG